MDVTSNANGKRPLNTISNGLDSADNDDIVPLNGLSAISSRGRDEYPPRTHDASGYTWTKEEDAPGYSWMNKKALDEASRALDGLVHKDSFVRDKYGEPFELADKERAIQASLSHR